LPLRWSKIPETTILENNIIQTTGSAASPLQPVLFLPSPVFVFIPRTGWYQRGGKYFNYLTILILASFGGMLGR